MANELNSYNLKSYETIRFVSGKKKESEEKNNTDDFFTIKRNHLLRWLTTHDMWILLKQYVSELSEDTFTITESNYDLYIFVIFCYILKKHHLQISRSKYKKIKKVARQKKDGNFDIIVCEDTQISIPPEKVDELKNIICSYLSNQQITSILKEKMSEDLSNQFDIQLWRYNRE